MKKFNFSLVTILAMSAFAMAGGNIAPVVEEPVVVPEAVVVSDSGFYVGIAYSIIGSDITNIADDIDLDMGAVMLDAGYKFNDYIAVEGRYWIGVDEDCLSFDALETDTDAWGIYIKPMYPVTDSFDIYGLLGYGSAALNDAITFDADVEGISWGVGASYSFTDSISIFVDYVAFTEDTITDNKLTDIIGINDAEYDHSFDTVNFGVNYKF